MTITRVQGNVRGTSTSSSISVTMPFTPTINNMLVAAIDASSWAGFVSVSGISQEGVNWSQQVYSQYNDGASDYLRAEIWVGKVTATCASQTLTVTLSGTPLEGAACDVCEYSGVATSNFLDKTQVSSGINSVPNTGTTATTTSNHELWVGAIVSYETTQSAATNYFALLDGQQISGPTYWTGLSYLEKIVYSTGQAYSAVNNSTYLYGWVGCIATFKADTNYTEHTNLTVDNTLTFIAPQGATNSYGNGTIGICAKDSVPPGGAGGAYLEITQGLLAEDIVAYGFLGTATDPNKQAGGGAILIGHGLTAPSCPPYISMTDSDKHLDQYSNDPSTTIDGYFYVNTTSNTIRRHRQYPTATWETVGPVGSIYYDTLYLFNKINPTLALGNLYLGTVYATNLRYHTSLSTFDAIDDLAVLKQIKTISDKDGKAIIDPESITHLKDEGGFYDSAKMDGWHISVQKKLLDRIELLETKLSRLTEQAT